MNPCDTISEQQAELLTQIEGLADRAIQDAIKAVAGQSLWRIESPSLAHYVRGRWGEKAWETFSGGKQ
jgi:hypothetical protein